jgi:hypothetical protein
MECPHLPLPLVERMLGALELHPMHLVQLLLREVGCRGILDQVAGVLPLAQPNRGERVVVAVERVEHVDERALVPRDVLVGRQFEVAFPLLVRDVADAAEILDAAASHQPLGQRDDRLFRHAIHEDIRLGVKEDGTPDTVRPEVIVGNPPQAGLDAAQDDRRRVLEEPPDQVRVHDHRPVRATVVSPPRREVVRLLFSLHRRVVGHHGVNAAAGHAPEQLWLSQPPDVGVGMNIRLGDDAHAIARLQEHLADDRYTDEGAVDVAIARHEDDVEPVPAEGIEFLSRSWKKHGGRNEK